MTTTAFNEPCGGCGAKLKTERCIGCMHETEDWQSHHDQANTTVSELLPCPFCGDKAISGTTLDDFGYVVCVSEKCWGMAGYLPSEAEAITAWNRRATADVTEAGMERAKVAYRATATYPIVPANHEEALLAALLAALNPPMGR